jgi:signal transduction histidine kinase
MTSTKPTYQPKQAVQSSATWVQRACHVVEQVNAKPEFEEALGALVKELLVYLQADRCFIINFDRNTMPLPISIEARRNDEVISFIGELPPAQRCPYLNKAMGNKLVWVEDVTEDTVLNQHWKTFFAELKIYGFVACPIIYNEAAQCIFVIHTQAPRAWSEDELLFIETCATQLAEHIQKAKVVYINRQFRETKAQFEHLYDWERKTKEVLQVIRLTSERKNLFTLAIAELAKCLNADRAFIIEFDDDVVRPIRYEYRSTDLILPFTGMIPPWTFCPYLAKSAQQEMAWSSDTYNDLVFAGNQEWYCFSRKYAIRSIVVAPVAHKGKLTNVLVFHTIEPRHWTEQELLFIKVVTDQLFTLYFQEKVQEELNNTAQAKSNFLAKMSHELRTPLNAIIGYAKMLEKGMAGPITGKQTEFIHYISSSGEHLLNLVNDILDLSKIEAGKMDISLKQVDINSLIATIAPMVEEEANNKSLHLSFQIQPDLKFVEIDPHRFKQILLNLISNAIKFNHENGSIFVRLNKFKKGASPEDPQDEWLILEVQDTGIGIPSSRLHELFSPFHQIDNSISRAHEGSGLGLILTKEMVELHHGQISVASIEDVGTTFTVKIPINSRLS